MGISPSRETPSPEPILAGPSTFIDPDDTLRGRLNAELLGVRDQIAGWSLHDIERDKIVTWHQEFTERLRLQNSRVRGVYLERITALQGILCDPIFGAPLDESAVVGNDMHTYSTMALAVHRYISNEEYRGCFSEGTENPPPFAVLGPHALVLHMVRWLQSHNALFYSDELRRAYNESLPQARPEDVRVQADRLAALQPSSDAREAELRSAQMNAIGDMFEERLRACFGRLEERMAPLRAAAGLPPREQRLRVGEEEIGRRIDRMAEQDRADIARLQEQRARMVREAQATRAEANDAAEELERLLAAIESRLEQHIQTELRPIQVSIDETNAAASARVHEAEERDQEALRQVRGVLDQARATVDDLRQRGDALERAQHAVADQIHAAQNDEIVLQQEIISTRVAIEEMKKRASSGSLFSTMLAVCGSMFLTWGLCSLLQATGFKLGAYVVRDRIGLILRK